jgi:hypothetical protein
MGSMLVIVVIYQVEIAHIDIDDVELGLMRTKNRVGV